VPVAVDDGAEQRREALTIVRVHIEFLLGEDHDDAAITLGHRQVHGRVAEFIGDLLLGAGVKEKTDE
jgi:hypothetical protein